MGRGEMQKRARRQSLKEETRRRRIERSSPADEAEQGRPELFMAAAAKGDGGRNGTLGLRGGPRCPFMELSSRGWPQGSTATAAGLCERGGESLAGKETSGESLAGGAGGKKKSRTASPARLGHAGEGKRRLGPRRKMNRAQLTKGLFHLNKQLALKSFVEQKARN